MVFVAFAYLLAVRLHFTYSMMAIMTMPLVHDNLVDQLPCPDTVLNLTENSTKYGADDERLNWTVRQQAAVMGGYYIGMLLSAFPGGVYANRNHEKFILLCCVAATAASVALMPVASVRYNSWTAATVLRFIQGLFNWNVKQLFVYMTAEYETPTNELNQVVLWDRIILRNEKSNLHLKNMRTKYYFWDDGNGLRGNKNITLTLSYNIIPNVGRLPIIGAIGSHTFSFPSQYTR